ncbi:MAG: hypothetical protein PWP03_715 [Candidatus Woesearchaeota archaeon]|nr:hypothetical protein [Candidatus Woesearchaeota archaeon]
MIKKDCNLSDNEKQTLIEYIKFTDDFIKTPEKELARTINMIIEPLTRIWKAKLTKTFFNHNGIISYDLQGIEDEILKQEILINAHKRRDLENILESSGKFEINENILYIPHNEQEESEIFKPIPLEQNEIKGWHPKDMFLSIYRKGHRIYGYTSFDLPKEENPIEKSISNIHYSNAAISFLLEMYYYKNIAPYRDAQTGVYNKNYLEEELKRIKKSNPNGNYLIINIDINNLKKVNDEYGHLEGDKLINYVADKLKENLRNNEIIIRWGGDEFLILAKDVNIEEVSGLFRRLKSILSENKSTELKEFYGVSIGFAYGTINSDEDFEKLYRISDKMMYKNKNAKAMLYFNPKLKGE